MQSPKFNAFTPQDNHMYVCSLTLYSIFTQSNSKDKLETPHTELIVIDESKKYPKINYISRVEKKKRAQSSYKRGISKPQYFRSIKYNQFCQSLWKS